MTQRIGLSLSATFHVAVLALLALIKFERLPMQPAPPIEIDLSSLPVPVPPQLPTLPKADPAPGTPADALVPAAQQQSAPASPAAKSSDQTSQVANSPQSERQPAATNPAQVSLAPAPVLSQTPHFSPPEPSAAPAPRPVFDAAGVAKLLAGRVNGARRPSIDTAAIGNAIDKARPRGAAGLTGRQLARLEEMIRSQITPCWNPPQADITFGRVTVAMRIRLERSGQVVGIPVPSTVNGQTPANAAYARSLVGSVRRAVLRCAPLRLPPEQFEAWSDVELTFDPRDVS